MNLDDTHTFFIVTILGLALIVASPALAVIVPFEDGYEHFSEFWLLGPDHMAEGYPFNVNTGEKYDVFVGVSIHMGRSEYYRVCLKFSNSSDFLPDVDGGVASPLPCLYDFWFFVGNGEVEESVVTFGFENVEVEDNILSVSNITVNGASFAVDASAVWDSKSEGYFFDLFFELWRYDDENNSFRFDNRFVGLWLNMTSS